jgi:predicted enzyme related to lactoylglutathione lyase
MGVTGIGGLFFRSKDPKALGAWYAKHLGVGGGEWGLWDQQTGQTVFSPFKADTNSFPAHRQWMLNLRVDGIDTLLDSLRACGVDVLTNPEWDAPGVGHFARIHDPEADPIELWEPDSQA